MNNILEIVSTLGGKPNGDNSWQCHCPVHDDKESSLTISLSNGKILFYCHAGCSQKAVLEELKRRNLWAEKSTTTKKKIVATYDYTDEDNNLLYQVCRFEPKDFRQRRPNGKGGWIWNLKDTRRVLYCLPKILVSDQVFICEGEKDVAALNAQGLTATTNCGGASNWITEYSASLENRECIILPDNDEPGLRHAIKIAQSLDGKARSVKIIELPGLPIKGDISDWFAMGHNKEDLLELVAKFDFTKSDNMPDFTGPESESTASVTDTTIETSVLATQQAESYLGKKYTKDETIIFLEEWNKKNTQPLSKKDIKKIVKSVYKEHEQKHFYGIAEAVKKITILKYPDGSTKYNMDLGEGRTTLLIVDDLMSSRRTINKIVEATRVVFNPPKQDRWLDLVRQWLGPAEEVQVAVEESELGIIKEIINEWLIQWNRQKDSEHISLPAMLKNSCVVDRGILYFTLTHVEEELRFKNVKLTRTLLCEFLRKLGAKVTEPRKRFNGSRIRTWEIAESNCE